MVAGGAAAGARSLAVHTATVPAMPGLAPRPARPSPLEADGLLDRVEGAVQETVGDAKRALRDPDDDL
jgi:hypothetical protein